MPADLRMRDEEVAAFLADQRFARVATVFEDGSPHVVPIAHVLLDGQLAFLTGPRTNTATNLQRDPRVSCVIDDGQSYADFRGIEQRVAVVVKADCIVSWDHTKQ